MKSQVETHYENLLAEHYTWMSGGLAARVEDNHTFFAGLGVTLDGAHALDLGCGSGFQSLALRQLGCRVTGVDLSRQLIEELRRNGDPSVQLIQGNIADPACYAGHGPFDLAVCMGDTLTHLPDEATVARMFAGVAANLRPGANFILRYRDMTVPLTGTDRILPLRSDENRIFTCFLEYLPHHVAVHDVLHLRTASGWTTLKSTFNKLRLAPDRVNTMLVQAGFSINRHDVSHGLATTISAAPGGLHRWHDQPSR